MGYQEEQVEAIMEYIAEHGHVVDAPSLRQDHYEVFDCAMGERSISPMGHVQMMAAVQPFLSGAISKTVNMPESATVEEIEDTYFQGWKLGLKAMAIYRDNCKVGQRCQRRRQDEGRGDGRAGQGRRVPADAQAAAEEAPGRDDVILGGGCRGYMTARPTRTTDWARSSSRWQAGFDSGRRDGRVLDRDLGRPAVRRPAGDIRLEVHEHALRAGGHDRRPRHPDGPASVVDYIFRRLALDYLPIERGGLRHLHGEGTRRAARHRRGRADEENDSSAGHSRLRWRPRRRKPAAEAKMTHRVDAKPAPAAGAPWTELLELLEGNHDRRAAVFTCGTKMRPAGSCYVCEGCGSTSGCS